MTSVLGMQNELKSQGPMHILYYLGHVYEQLPIADTPQFSAL